MALKGPRVHLVGPAQDLVHLIQVTLDDAHVGYPLHLRAGGEVLVARLPVVVADADVLLAEFGAQVVQVQDHGVSRTVLDELAALAIEDVPPGSRDDDPPFILLTFLLMVDRALAIRNRTSRYGNRNKNVIAGRPRPQLQCLTISSHFWTGR